MGAAVPLMGQHGIRSWGQVVFDTAWSTESFTRIGAADRTTLALRNNGMLVAWGNNGAFECAIPPLPPGVVYVDATGGLQHCLALRSDGSIVTWPAVVPAPPTLPPG